jgi:antitoxin component HigA of HigAB toxin-antitoxin module
MMSVMEIRPIKNERDYRRVLKDIEGLMDAKANTAAGDRLDVLATLAEAWEEKHPAIVSASSTPAGEVGVSSRRVGGNRPEPPRPPIHQ